MKTLLKITRQPNTRLLTYLFVFLLCCAQACAQKDAKIYVKGENRMENHYGIPFLWLEGSNYEVGYQYGTFLKERIVELDKLFGQFKHDYIVKMSKNLPFFKRVGARLFGNLYIKHKVKQLAKKISPELMEQLKGVSDASGVKLNVIIEITLATDFGAQYGCSGFTLRDKNRIIQGRSFDVPFTQSELLKYPVIVRYKINGKIPYTNITSILKFLVNTGFNDAGITFSENANNNYKPFDKQNCNLFVDVNKIITDCKCMADVDSVIKKLKIPYGYIYTITSTQENKIAVYDMLGKMAGKASIDSVCITTGRTYTKDLQKKTETIYSSSYHNYNRELKYRELIDSSRDTSFIDKAIGLLSNTDFYTYKDQPCDIETINNFESIQSILFDLSNNNVYFAFDSSFSGWNTWYQFNSKTNQVSICKNRNKIADSQETKTLIKLLAQYELLDQKDTLELKKMITLFDTNPSDNFWSNNAAAQLSLFKLKNYKKAETYTDRLIQNYPDVAAGWYYKGLILKCRNQPNESVQAFEDGLKATISNETLAASMYEELALANNQLGNLDKAKRYAQKSLTIHNQYWSPRWLLPRLEKLKAIENQLH